MIHIEYQLKPAPFPIIRTPGVIAEDFAKYQVLPFIEHGSLRHKGTIGCFFSHLAAFRLALDRRAEWLPLKHVDDCILIFEDDTVLHPEFFQCIRDIKFPADAQALFFDVFKGRKHKQSTAMAGQACAASGPRTKHIIGRIDDTYPKFVGAHCYAVPVGKIQDLIDLFTCTQTFWEPDGFMYSSAICYYHNSGLVSINEGFHSDRHLDAHWQTEELQKWCNDNSLIETEFIQGFLDGDL